MGADRDHVDTRRGQLVGLVGWMALVVTAVVWPRWWPLPDRSGVDAPPFYGRWGWHDLAGIVPAVGVAGLLVWAWPLVTDRLGTSPLAVVTGAASALWAVLLAGSGGVEQLWSPLANRHGYLGVGADLDAGAFLRTFVERLGNYPTHVKGHPPGMPLLLRAMDTVGLGGPRWAAVLCFVVWGIGIAAVVVTVRELGGEGAARRACGTIAFLPAAVFAGTTFDAFFAGAIAVTVAVLVWSIRRSGWRSDVSAVVGGALASGCLHLSYGFVPLALIPLAIAIRERRARPLLLAGFGAAVVVALFVAGGFWWLDGLDATRGFYADGISQFRPYSYFVFVGNPAALALALGPVAAAGLGGLAVRGARTAWSERWPLLAAASLAAVAAADLSGLSNAEVERIWLPFMPWIAVAATAVVTQRSRRWWLATSLALGLALQVGLVTPW
jgi:hypothetical protein